MQAYILLFGLLVICDFLVKQASISIPGSILGLVVLFSVFLIRGRVDQCVDNAAKALLKFLPLFLVPIGVGVKELLVNIDEKLLVMVGVSILALIFAISITALSIHVYPLCVKKITQLSTLKP